MSEWIPFLFPKCPRCQKQWGKNYHRNCIFNGQLLVEPYSRQVKCQSCSTQWYILNSKFYCSCGYEFYPSEVEESLSTTQLLRQRLLEKLKEMDLYESDIATKSKSSFQQWSYNLSYTIAKAVGRTVTEVQNFLKSFFNK
ncbi:hypothetical protein BI308_22845 [Roseofilum reptotaenium AO1-A]|uniref:Uncharacterized protein n=1 Tax=Roseofilum reptotaenium AO1-A TaxID=1925591 RepID=A0A1L9QKS1_9CYAN|nr:hypothetical protein BI308_22845 [Roseofilum reptotaenium AO1-A]